MGTMFGVGPLAAAVLLLLPGIPHLAHGDTIAGYPNGLGDLLGNVNSMTQNLQNGIAQMQQRIQQDVQAQLQQAHETASKAIEDAKKSGSVIQVGPSITVRNGNNVQLVSGGGVVLGPGNSQSLTRQSVIDPNTGKSYIIETQQFVQNGLLVHKERREDHSNGTVEESGYTLDLSQSNAQPVSLPTKVSRL